MLNRTIRSAALPYPKHGRRGMPATMRSFCKCVFFFPFFSFQLLEKPWLQVSSLDPPDSFLLIAHRVQQSHCSSVLHRVLLTHALALSASQILHKKTFLRIYTSIHSGGLELTKLTYTGLEDILMSQRGDRLL